MRRNEIPSLDGLRGVAALLVVIAHISKTFALGSYAGTLGSSGVFVFFALSGFLMAHLSDGKAISPQSVGRFYLRRFARVFPAFALVATVSWCISGTPFLILPVYDLGAHLLLLQGASVLWTIPVEMCFYALFPLVWLVLNRSQTPVPLLIITAAWLLLAPLAEQMLPKDVQFLQLVQFGQIFLAGAVVAKFMAFGDTTPDRRSDAAFLACVVLLFLAAPYSSARVFRHPFFWSNPVDLIVVGTLLFACICSPLAARFLAKPLMRWLGTISYSLYLWHLFAVGYVHRFLPDIAVSAQIVLMVLGAVAIASVSYYTFESPMRRLINGLLDHRLKTHQARNAW